MNKILCEKEKVQENNRRHITRIFFEKANEVRRGFKSKHTTIRIENKTLLTKNNKIVNAFKNILDTLK